MDIALLYHMREGKYRIHAVSAAQVQNKCMQADFHNFLKSRPLLTFVTVSSSKSWRTSAFSRAKTLSSILTFGVTVGCIHTRTHKVLILLLITLKFKVLVC